MKSFATPPDRNAPPHPTPFKFISPVGGEIFEVGSIIQISWVGGPPTPDDIALSLVNINQWTVVNIPIVADEHVDTNPGTFSFQIPDNFFFGLDNKKMSPTDYFEFVIGDVARTTWTYGPSFTIWCDAASYNPKLISLTEAEAQTIVAAANIINKIPPLKGIVFNSIFLPDSSGS